MGLLLGYTYQRKHYNSSSVSFLFIIAVTLANVYYDFFVSYKGCFGEDPRSDYS